MFEEIYISNLNIIKCTQVSKHYIVLQNMYNFYIFINNFEKEHKRGKLYHSITNR
jgi:hypothetical protein